MNSRYVCFKQTGQLRQASQKACKKYLNTNVTEEPRKGQNMKIDVKKNGETILHREDAKSITDKGGAYEIAYADGEGQVVFKGENVAIELKD